jgi:hypothetical protein
MNAPTWITASLLATLAIPAAALAQQQSGTVGRGAPEDVFLEVTQGADGLALSADEFHFAFGGYYRFNLICPAAGVENEAGLSFSAPEFLQNAHLRILSVSDTQSGFQEVPEINFHLQGLNFRMIDCEGLNLAVRFSFHPLRAGTYPFTVLDDTVEPPRELMGELIVE